MSERPRLSTIERAVQIAKEGQCGTVGEIRAILRAEGYEAVDGHLYGPSIKAQLLRMIEAARR